jgi:hypothetical protein
MWYYVPHVMSGVMDEITIREEQTGVDWGEEWGIDQVEIEPTVWAHVASSHGDVFVAIERVNGGRARAQVVGARHVADVDYVGDPFEYSVKRSQTIQDIARDHLRDPKQTIQNYLDERHQ